MAFRYAGGRGSVSLRGYLQGSCRRAPINKAARLEADRHDARVLVGGVHGGQRDRGEQLAHEALRQHRRRLAVRRLEGRL
eukprot:scaffold52153_cov60-Phaeocystis_antarctica.AAC.2